MDAAFEEAARAERHHAALRRVAAAIQVCASSPDAEARVFPALLRCIEREVCALVGCERAKVYVACEDGDDEEDGGEGGEGGGAAGGGDAYRVPRLWTTTAAGGPGRRGGGAAAVGALLHGESPRSAEATAAAGAGGVGGGAGRVYLDCCRPGRPSLLGTCLVTGKAVHASGDESVLEDPRLDPDVDLRSLLGELRMGVQVRLRSMLCFPVPSHHNAVAPASPRSGAAAADSDDDAGGAAVDPGSFFFQTPHAAGGRRVGMAAGVIQVLNHRDKGLGGFTDKHRDLLGQLAGHVAVALETARRHARNASRARAARERLDDVRARHASLVADGATTAGALAEARLSIHRTETETNGSQMFHWWNTRVPLREHPPVPVEEQACPFFSVSVLLMNV